MSGHTHKRHERSRMKQWKTRENFAAFSGTLKKVTRRQREDRMVVVSGTIGACTQGIRTYGEGLQCRSGVLDEGGIQKYTR